MYYLIFLQPISLTLLSESSRRFSLETGNQSIRILKRFHIYSHCMGATSYPFSPLAENAGLVEWLLNDFKLLSIFANTFTNNNDLVPVK
jgi:hypothetical protein